MFIVRKSGTLNTIEFTQSSSFSLSPNPTTSISTLKSNNDNSIITVEIYNIIGQRVFNKGNINKQEFVLPTKDYNSGVYLVKINNSLTKKLVIK